MRESRTYGSVRGARGNSRPYREIDGFILRFASYRRTIEPERSISRANCLKRSDCVSVPVARVSFAELDRFIAPLQKAAAPLSETILQADEET